jgi:hypothetical protein
MVLRSNRRDGSNARLSNDTPFAHHLRLHAGELEGPPSYVQVRRFHARILSHVGSIGQLSVLF